jgi:cytochrome c peroxidase
LEAQAFEPVTNPVEMHDTWPNAIAKLKAHSSYPNLFYAAFGTKDFDSTHVVKAIAQFERTLISSNSKWDMYLRGETQLNLSETRGYEIFFTERGDCFHCHSTILFTDNEFHNIGLDEAFSDEGLFLVTNDPNDKGRFRTPTLRNAVFTAPYMHDGRFNTLEEVIDFYSEGLRYSPTIDPLMKNIDQGGIRLTDEEKFYLLAFLKTLTDSSFVLNPEYAAPQ